MGLFTPYMRSLKGTYHSEGIPFHARSSCFFTARGRQLYSIKWLDVSITTLKPRSERVKKTRIYSHVSKRISYRGSEYYCCNSPGPHYARMQTEHKTLWFESLAQCFSVSQDTTSIHIRHNKYYERAGAASTKSVEKYKGHHKEGIHSRSSKAWLNQFKWRPKISMSTSAAPHVLPWNRDIHSISAGFSTVTISFSFCRRNTPLKAESDEATSHW